MRGGGSWAGARTHCWSKLWRCDSLSRRSSCSPFNVMRSAFKCSDERSARLVPAALPGTNGGRPSRILRAAASPCALPNAYLVLVILKATTKIYDDVYITRMH